MKYEIELIGAFPDLLTKYRKKILSEPSKDEDLLKTIVQSWLLDRQQKESFH